MQKFSSLHHETALDTVQQFIAAAEQTTPPMTYPEYSALVRPQQDNLGQALVELIKANSQPFSGINGRPQQRAIIKNNGWTTVAEVDSVGRSELKSSVTIEHTKRRLPLFGGRREFVTLDMSDGTWDVAYSDSLGSHEFYLAGVAKPPHQYGAEYKPDSTVNSETLHGFMNVAARVMKRFVAVID